MEQKLKQKLIDNLAFHEKNWKNWEWSDLIPWMQDLKIILERFHPLILNNFLAADLSKRMSLCLNPTLPQGIHIKAIEIYSLLLKTKESYHYNIFLLSVLSYFKLMPIQSKLKLLDLVQEIIKSPKILIEPVVISLLQGFEEKGEVFSKVLSIINDLIDINPSNTYKALWKFFLKSNVNKLSVLTILKNKKYLIEEVPLVINAVISGLSDGNIRVKRDTLDIIKSSFPISQDLSMDKKVVLMKSVLIKINIRDNSLCRRLWEWVFPNEITDTSLPVQVLTQALLSIIQEHPNQLLVIRAAELLLQSDCWIHIFEVVCVELLEFIAVGSFNAQELSSTYQKIFKENQEILFQKFFYSFDKIFYRSQHAFAKVVMFLLIQDIYTKDFCFKLLDYICKNYLKITNKEEYLDICVKLSKIVDKIPDFRNIVQNLHLIVIEEVHEKLLDKISSFLMNLSDIGVSYKEILLDLKLAYPLSRDSEFFSVMNFISKFKDAPISKCELNYIWKSILTNDKAYNLMYY
jgi:Dopey, N-terminal